MLSLLESIATPTSTPLTESFQTCSSNDVAREDDIKTPRSLEREIWAFLNS